MLELLRTRPLEQITVKELAERAEVSKNSFYNHYEDLEALAQDCYMHGLVYFGSKRKRRGDYANRQEAVCELLEQRVQSLEFLRANPNLARAILANTGVSPYYSQAEELEEELIPSTISRLNTALRELAANTAILAIAIARILFLPAGMQWCAGGSSME